MDERTWTRFFFYCFNTFKTNFQQYANYVNPLTCGPLKKIWNIWQSSLLHKREKLLLYVSVNWRSLDFDLGKWSGNYDWIFHHFLTFNKLMVSYLNANQGQWSLGPEGGVNAPKAFWWLTKTPGDEYYLHISCLVTHKHINALTNKYCIYQWLDWSETKCYSCSVHLLIGHVCRNCWACFPCCFNETVSLLQF